MIGRSYLERGRPVVLLVRWGKGGGPRNVLIRRADGERVVRPFRGLRKMREDLQHADAGADQAMAARGRGSADSLAGGREDPRDATAGALGSATGQRAERDAPEGDARSSMEASGREPGRGVRRAPRVPTGSGSGSAAARVLPGAVRVGRPDLQASAEFSPCGLHRLRLDRWWSEEPRALICGANPSKAGAEKYDPTVWRIVELLHGRPGIGGFTLVNVETYIATDPADLVRWCDRQDLDALQQVRRANLSRIRKLSAAAAIRIVAWGALPTPGLHTNRIIAALSLDGAHPLLAFELTGQGAPKHPLARGRHRIAAGQPLIVWRAAEEMEVR